MKILKSDLKPSKKEIQEFLKRRDYSVSKQVEDGYQCSSCLKISKTKDNYCQHCGAYHDEKFTSRKKNYYKVFSLQLFRKRNNFIVELLFAVRDYIDYDGYLGRDYILIRKTEYKDDINILVNSWINISYMGSSLYLGYAVGTHPSKFTYYKEEASKSMGNSISWSNIVKAITINKELLLEHKILGRVYNEETINDVRNFRIEQALKHPYAVEMLERRSDRWDKYWCLPTLERYKDTYIKYFEYFEKVGKINASLLSRLSKIKEMITYNVFEKLVNVSVIPKEFRTRKELELFSKILDKNGFDSSSYKDYLRLAAARGLDTKLEDVRFNKNWKLLHDQWVEEIEYKKNIEKEIKFKKIMSKYTDKVYKLNGKEIIVKHPESISDLFEESKELKHCVKDYVNRIIDKKSLVLFVREKEDEPYITCEIIENKIHQMRGKYNLTGMVTKNHRQAVNNYIKDLKGATQCHTQ